MDEKKAPKKFGIVADNYKIKHYKKRLRKEGYKFRTSPFSHQVTQITIETTADQLPNVQKLCQELELGFKHSN